MRRERGGGKRVSAGSGSGRFHRCGNGADGECSRSGSCGRHNGDTLVRRMEGQHGIHTLEHAEAIGLGSRTYELVSIDG